MPDRKRTSCRRHSAEMVKDFTIHVSESSAENISGALIFPATLLKSSTIHAGVSAIL
jgi:hypothetical protein